MNFLNKDLSFIDALKLLAILTMVMDHLGLFFFPDQDWLRAVGRMSMPIWAFVLGYLPSKKLPWLIILWGFILTLYNDYILMMSFEINILVGLGFSRILLQYGFGKWLDKYNYGRSIFIVFLLMLWPISILGFEYGTLILAFALIGESVYLGEKKEIWCFNLFLVFALTIIGGGIFLEFSGFEYGLSLLCILCLFLLLYFVDIKETFKIKSFILKFLARNTLAFYVLHWLVFSQIMLFKNFNILNLE